MNEIISPWELYWVLQLDSIRVMFVLFSIFAGVVSCVSGLIKLMDIIYIPDEDVQKTTKKVLKTSTLVFLVSMVLATATPSTKNMVAILIVPAVVNSKDAHELGKENLGVIKLALGRMTEILEKDSGK